jgi:hypothetical protein
MILIIIMGGGIVSLSAFIQDNPRKHTGITV